MSTADASLPETGVILPESGRSVPQTVAFAVEAEAAGFDSVWCSEGWGYEPFALLGRLAGALDCPIGTAIANVYARTPAATAMNAMTLHAATGGRFVLGLGTSTRPIVEGFHGATFERPVRRVRETIEVVRHALSGERITHEGTVGSLDGFSLDHADGGVPVPILNAALGPTNLAMSTEYADGVLTYLFPIDAIPGALDRAADRARDPTGTRIAVNVPACVSDDGERARAVLQRHVAYYVGAVDVYNGAVARNGFADVAEDVRRSWDAGDRERAREAVSTELLDAVGVWGTPERARERFDALRSGPVDTALVSFPSNVDAEMRDLALAALGA